MHGNKKLDISEVLCHIFRKWRTWICIFLVSFLFYFCCICTKSKCVILKGDEVNCLLLQPIDISFYTYVLILQCHLISFKISVAIEQYWPFLFPVLRSDHGVKAHGDGLLLIVPPIELTDIISAGSTNLFDLYVVFTCNTKRKTSSISS